MKLKQLKTRIRKTVLAAYWVKHNLKEIIVENVLKQKALSANEKVKLAKVLVTIIYAEEQQDRHGKILTRIIEKTFHLLKLEHKIDTSLGSFQLNIKNHRSLGLTESEFKAKIRNDKTGIIYVIKHVLDIGLHKDAEHIIAEYNHEVNGTVVAAIQRTLNALREEFIRLTLLEGQEILKTATNNITTEEWISELKWPRLDEDGFYGMNTQKAIKNAIEYLKLDIDFYKHQDPEKLLAILAKKTGVEYPPFVPSHVQIRNGRYLLKVLKSSLSDLTKLKKVLDVFKNNVNVEQYTAYGMEVYKRL